MQKSKMHQLFVITFFILKIVMKGCGPTFTVLYTFSAPDKPKTKTLRAVRQTLTSATEPVFQWQV